MPTTLYLYYIMLAACVHISHPSTIQLDDTRQSSLIYNKTVWIK